jgi:uncharacterized protein (TIGR02246 family)
MAEDPTSVVRNLMAAINQGDVDKALSCYEREAVIIAQPGQLAHGLEAIRRALEAFVALKPTLQGQTHTLIEAKDTVLFCSKWTLVGTSPDGNRVEMSGTSSDVLRRQADGRWLVAIDNPWGTTIVS